MPLRKWIKSANHAIEGILHAAKTQRHMRYHLYAAIIVLISAFLLGVGRIELVVLISLAILVISIEMINTSIEIITDILFKEYDPRAKAIKDTAAGAVLIAAMGAVIIGYIMLFEPLREFFYSGMDIAKRSEPDIAVLALIVVLILVVITKSFFGKGEPLRGGMPSGHSAVAFSVWVAITIMTESFMVSMLVMIMAIFIAQSRVTVGIHKPWEVILGGLLGMTTTFLLFKVFL
ncbi:MAG TPA: phosphatase PAP2 family protein [Nitrospirae bacterium]|nr:undecaprenol kinase [bacterium BMS3Bbin09]HDN94886.1 phosphatase PAP2 family protein [Nitrospirota bacterium]HDZ84269.1 phosphatase PAP2 family protein [Nitrospirota bacterium]